jgi:PTH1 family peptidyl-tRNA hydrolase
VAQHLRTGDFLRLRVGVGRPERGDRRPVADFVLSPFAPDLDVESLVARAADAVELVATEGLEAAQQRFNERPA